MLNREIGGSFVKECRAIQPQIHVNRKLAFGCDREDLNARCQFRAFCLPNSRVKTVSHLLALIDRSCVTKCSIFCNSFLIAACKGELQLSFAR